MDKEKKEVKKIDIKELYKKNKKLVLGVLIGLVALIVIIVLVVALSGSDEKKPNNNESNNSGNGNGSGDEEVIDKDAIISNEDTIEDEYGFSKEDAINAVKKIYHSDNYKFEAKARKDNMYEVTVTNTDTNTADVYEVDPNDGSFVYITNISEE